MSPFFSPTRKKVIFFDMNNTILDRRQCFDSAFLEVMKIYGKVGSEETILTAQEALLSYKIGVEPSSKTPIRSPISP